MTDRDKKVKKEEIEVQEEMSQKVKEDGTLENIESGACHADFSDGCKDVTI